MRPRTPTLLRTGQRLLAAVLILALLSLLSGSRELSTLNTVLTRGELRLVTRPGPLTYYEDGRGANGFEYLLARKFATHLGVRLRVTTTDTLASLGHMLGGPNADFAAATLTVTAERRRQFRFSDPYGETAQVLVYRRGTAAPRTIDDLLGRDLVVITDSAHEERLEMLRASHPGLAWRALPDAEMSDLLEMVQGGEAELAIIDTLSFDAHSTLYHNVRAAFTLGDPEPLAWAFPRHGDDSLARAANAYLAEMRANGQLDELKARFFTGVEDFSVSSAQVFFSLVDARLPRFEAMFKTVAAETGLDWHLLAAIAYQESHWNPRAVSPTGVKGLMMLTRAAAGEVAVADRTDPEQSLWGGARYFLKLKARIPARIPEPDRTWFALAAYNVGLGHLEDARILTQRAGRDPDLWREVREYLPLLQKRQYYSTVKNGYARGNEPVLYVRNIRKYLRILQWRSMEAARRQDLAPPAEPEAAESWDPRSFLSL
ncbi:MAG: membrane-bound lytic murein transglycosylase MltF [Porticoccaceae bacterium]|jgi:membrane-bound lytic murein transglycosylase F|nr:membrane-bound lytic murein transglycosylase MltF [Porticoccaceae bacterium]MEA3299091.1 membrane-bound lytic murein transglycosylase MltF [Pseudomonadota bacterium]